MRKCYGVVVVLISICAPSWADERHRASSGDEAVAIVGKRVISDAELELRAAPQLLTVRAEEYAQKRRALEDMIAEEAISAEAKRRGITSDELIEIEVGAKTPPVSREEALAAYQATKDRMGPMAEQEAVESMEKSIRATRERDRRVAYIQELRDKAGVRVLLSQPRVDMKPGDGPSLGPEAAAVLIVEFIDFECPYCGRVAALLRREQLQHPNDVRLVFRHLPLPSHSQAKRAAEAAECARDQGKFWEMSDRMLAGQNALRSTDLRDHAKALGLDIAAFDACLDSGKYRDRIEQDVTVGRSYGVAGTPAIFINGRLTRPLPEDIGATLAEELAAGKRRATAR